MQMKFIIISQIQKCKCLAILLVALFIRLVSLCLLRSLSVGDLGNLSVFTMPMVSFHYIYISFIVYFMRKRDRGNTRNFPY